MSVAIEGSMSDVKRCRCEGACGCGSNSRQSVGFSRPNFFAGQLLTDEDLRDTMNYMVEKSRLHNRHFFGEGVVCGLRVAPHPCPDERHKVIVHRGHAINGCGDDILVTRAEEVDVLAKVRQLIAENKSGYDCGDPCSHADSIRSRIGMWRREWARAGTPSEREGIEHQIAGLNYELESLALAAVPVKYGLYVRYVEHHSNLVAPYQVEDCSTTGCHASRIREGYSFELRCDEPRVYNALNSKLGECSSVIRDYKELQGTTLHGISALEMVQKILTQFEAIGQTPDEIPANPFEVWTDDAGGANPHLTLFREISFLPGSLTALSNDELRGLTLAELKTHLPDTLLYESSVIDWIGDTLGSAVPDPPLAGFTSSQLNDFRGITFLPVELVRQTDDRLKLLSLADMRSMLPDSIEFETQVLQYVKYLDLLVELKESAEQVTTQLSGIPDDTSESNPLDVDKQRLGIKAAHRFLSLASRALHLIDSPMKALLEATQQQLAREPRPDVTKLSLLRFVNTATSAEPAVHEDVVIRLVDRNSDLRTSIVSGEDTATFNSRARIVGELLETKEVEAVFARLDNAAQVVKSLIASGEVTLAPSLVSDLLGVRLTLFDGDDDLIAGSRFGEIRRQAEIVNRAVAEIARLCMCDALLPPCPDDDDSAVLLATVTVENCVITDVCNLSRRMVVSGPALRYWFNDFSSFLSGPRSSCCPSGKDIEDAKEAEQQRRDGQKVNWTKDVSVAIAEATQFLPLLIKDSSSQKDRVDQSALWEQLHASKDVETLQQVAVTPILPGVDDLFKLLGDPRTSEQMNFYLAKLAGRPETDIRNVLAWSREFGSPAEVRDMASAARQLALETQAGSEALREFVSDQVIIDDDGTDKPIKQFVGELDVFVSEQVTIDDGGTSKSLKQFVGEQVTINDGGTDKPLKQFVSEQVTVDDGGTDKPLKQFVGEQVTINDGGTDKPLKQFVSEQVTVDDGGTDKPLKQFVGEQATINDGGTDKPLKQFVSEQVTVDDGGTDKPLKQFVGEQVTINDGGTDKPLKQFVSEQVTVDDGGTDKPLKQFVGEQVTINDGGTDKPLKQFVSEQVTVDDGGTDKPLKQFVSEQVTIDDGGVDKPLKQFVGDLNTFVVDQVMIDDGGTDKPLKQFVAEFNTFVVDQVTFDDGGTRKEIKQHFNDNVSGSTTWTQFRGFVLEVL